MTAVVVVGAGIVGAACAYHLARAGARVTVLERGTVAGGASSAGEGNILVSDKIPGPELDLALWSRRLWSDIGADLGSRSIELEAKGGLVVADSDAERDQLTALAERQRAAGMAVTELAADELADYEPRLAPHLAGGAYFPQDAQVQPMLATAHLLRGLEVRCGVEVRGIETGPTGAVTGVRTGDGGLVPAGAVVNATGVSGGDLVAAAGTRLPVTPRRGFILVTEPLHGGRGPRPIRHKVYTAGYIRAVISDDAGPQTAAVIEGTKAGTVLIGSSRECRGFDPRYPLPVLRRLAKQAVELFPFLAEVRVLRAFHGFRPLTPDHLPVIGPDKRVAGLWHAWGHEGAGIGLAPATGALIAALMTGAAPGVDPSPFDPGRFDSGGPDPRNADPRASDPQHADVRRSE
jgi:D-hydroxyproline dehydrogenase subunit beta